MKNSKPLPPKRTISHTIGCNNNQPQKDKTAAAATTNSTDTGNTDTICDICVQNVPGPEREKIFALGRCDHYVCYVCSARLRAICDQQDCPICREKLDCVIFCANKNRSFEKHDIKSYIHDEKYKIYFENETIKEAFVKLLKFECLECLKKDSSSTSTSSSKQAKNLSDNFTSAKEFPDVLKLKSHLNFMHKLKLCDLCLQHNKLFPFEYSYYDNASLMEHMRKGEPKTSHRGHPCCSLCHHTFFNQEDLLQHMSREHFHCHLCGRHNTNMHIYFLDYHSLREHFKSKHFLCERENCRHEQFTSAFDTQIDYQLHVAQVHGGSNLSRGEARQQRTITLDSAPHRAPVDRREPRLPPNAAVVSTGTPATANSTDPRRQIPESMQQQIRQQRLPTRSEFPALGLGGSSSNTTVSTSQVVTVSGTNQFPSLAQVNPNQQSRLLNHRIISGPSSSRGSFVRSAGGGNCVPERLDEMDFPPLPEQPKPKGTRSKAKKSGANARDENLTLDQLINSSLTISAKNNNRSRSNKSNKNSKPKALKIQL
uniref:Zinc finger protein 598 n=1 Tax=Aceria tosichella TaxID=561515 RepID=A0A6G1SNU4_9ACAR